MIDQRKLPAQEVYVRCKTAPRSRARHQDDGHPRRAGDRRRGGAWASRSACARARRPARRSSRPSSTRLCELMACDAADGRQPVLGDRADEAIASPTRRRGRRVGRPDQGSARRAKRDAIHDEDVASCRAMGAFGAEVVPADARDPHALQRWRARDGRLRHGARRDPRRRRSRASASRCSPTRRGRSFRARG